MSYQSPIDVVMGQMNISYENGICKAVQNAGVCVDKNELLKALQYDRWQYQKGYADRDSEITRCRDCKYWLPMNRFDPDYHPGRGQCELNCWIRDFDWFCADGEKASEKE